MNLQYRDNSVPLAGYYEEATDTIYVSSGLPPLIAECVYLHELQHASCYGSDCECWWGAKAGNDDLAEYHAHKGELIAVLGRDSVALARAYLKGLAMEEVKIARDPKLWRSHKRAVARIKRLKAFKGVCRLAGGDQR